MSRLLRWLPVAWLAAIAVVVTWPAARLQALVGHPRCTAGCHAWVIDATREVLGGGSLWSEQLFFPHGGDVFRLYGSDLLGPLLLAPLSAVIPSWALVDLWVLLMVLANGLAAYALARRGLGMDRGPATVAGTAFLAAPFFLTRPSTAPPSCSPPRPCPSSPWPGCGCSSAHPGGWAWPPASPSASGGCCPPTPPSSCCSSWS